EIRRRTLHIGLGLYCQRRASERAPVIYISRSLWFNQPPMSDVITLWLHPVATGPVVSSSHRQ
ncbi:MAG: hypothetical protein ACRERD_19840, partial [Candidatus Binatia bacterium]